MHVLAAAPPKPIPRIANVFTAPPVLVSHVLDTSEIAGREFAANLVFQLFRLASSREHVNVREARILSCPVPVLFSCWNEGNVSWADNPLFLLSGDNTFSCGNNENLVTGMRMKFGSCSFTKIYYGHVRVSAYYFRAY